MKSNFMRGLAVAFMAVVGVFAATASHASLGAVGGAELAGLMPYVAVATAGGIARLASMPFGPRIFFDAPDRGGGGTKTAAELAAEFKQDFQTKHDKVKEIAEKALAEAEKGVTASATTKELADQAITGMNEAKARLDEMEQKMARRGSEGDQSRTAGERFVEDEGFKAFAGQTRPRGRFVAEVKDISSLTTDAAGSVGTLVRPDRAAPIELPRRRMTIRALIAPGTTASNLIEYDKEKGFTNNAAAVAEGALKPQSDIQYVAANAPVRTIAHWMRASVQILADKPGLQSMIDNRLRYGLAHEEEVQLLTGSGADERLIGLVTEATPFAAPVGAAAATQEIDKIRLAMLQVALAEYPANGIVTHPINWYNIETLKDGEGRYLIGNPQGTLSPTLWSLPVVATQAMRLGKMLVGAFDLAAQIFDRQDATVEVSTEDQDNFVRNKVTIRAEERLALAIYRPEALVYGDLAVPADA